MKSVVILISGRGSNMVALMEAGLPMQVKAVISNRDDAAGLDYARARGVPVHVISHRAYPERADFDAELSRCIDATGADFVILAGFMRIFTDAFVRRYQGRMINIHPSLLPAFTGLDTHRRAISAGVKLHGCTVHLVTPELDAGPIIIQAAVPVMPDDTPASLAARVLAEEHRIYPLAVAWLLDGRIRILDDQRTAIDGIGASIDAMRSPWEVTNPADQDN